MLRLAYVVGLLQLNYINVLGIIIIVFSISL